MLTAKCLGTKGWKGVGEFKHVTFNRFAELYPEYDFVFCGDNGQGDLLAGQLMAAGTPIPGEPSVSATILAVLIHEVLPDDKVLALEPAVERGDGWRKSLANQRLYHHQTYVGAAAELYERKTGLVSAEQLRDVAVGAIEDFSEDVTYHSQWSTPDKWLPYEKKLSADLQRADALLQKAGLQPLGTLQSVQELTPKLNNLAAFFDKHNYASDFDDDAAEPLVASP